jgi:hypothetical protein
MKIPNPYNYNLPVTPKMFFGRQEDMETLVHHLTAEPGDSFALVGGRRMGKTSLLRALRRVLEPVADGSPHGLLTIPIFLDLTGKGIDSVSSFFRKIRDDAEAEIINLLSLQPVDSRTANTHQPDLYSSYEIGLRRLLNRMGQDHPRHSDALIYQHRLAENTRQSRRHGDTDTLKAERSQIIEQLDEITLSALGLAFGEWCEQVMGSVMREDRPPALAFQCVLEEWGRMAMMQRGCCLRLILLLDECEEIVEQPWTSDLHGALRYLLVGETTESLLKLVMAGSHRFLTQVRQRTSPLWNVLKYHTLHILDEQATCVLIVQPTEGVLPERVVQTVVTQSGGHPFLTQYLMHHLWERGLEKATHETVQRIAAGFPHERNDFKDWADGLGDSGLRAYGVLAQAGEPLVEPRIRAILHPCPPDLLQALDALCYHGLVVQEADGESYRVAGEMFREWFATNVTSLEPSAIHASLVPAPDKTSAPPTMQRQPSIKYRAPWQEEVRQIGLDDLVRNIEFWNRERKLGLIYHGRRNNGAAWSVGNVLIRARAVTATTTNIAMDNYTWRDPDSEGRRAWTEIELLFVEHQIERIGGPAHMGRIAERTLSRIPSFTISLADQPTTAQARAEWEADMRAREPGISEAELDKTWGQLCQLAEMGRAEKCEYEARANKTPTEAAAEFFASLEAAGGGEYEPDAGVQTSHSEVQPIRIDTEGGPVVFVEGGDFVGRDKTVGVDQRGQTVHGSQTNVAGDVNGTLASGQFESAASVGSGDAVDLREAQGTAYKPSGPTEQQIGDHIVIAGDGNVVGDESSSRVAKATDEGPGSSPQ